MLVWHLNIFHLGQGTNTIQGIFLCLPKEQDIHLQVDPFSKMRKLRLLKIYNVRFPENHTYNLSDNLRVLEWHGYPSKALEPSFQPHNLVELNLSNSYIEKLWNENVRLFTKDEVHLVRECLSSLAIFPFITSLIT